LKSIKITSEKQIEEIVDLIHDEYFELKDSFYNKEERTVIIPYRRIFHEGQRKTIRNYLIYRVEEVDAIRSILTIKNVLKYNFIDKEKIGDYSFNEIKVSNNRMDIICDPNLEMNLEISNIDIESKDIELKGKVRISYFLFFIEGSSSKIIKSS
jgi:hypothetical protein